MSTHILHVAWSIKALHQKVIISELNYNPVYKKLCYCLVSYQCYRLLDWSGPWNNGDLSEAQERVQRRLPPAYFLTRERTDS